MTRISLIFAAVLAASLALPAHAQDVTAGNLKVSSTWARATPKGAGVGGGYMTITNTGTAPDRLIGGVSDVSKRFEIHEMSMTNGLMKMRPVADGLEIKPGQTVEFKPGGYHLMLMDLKQGLASGSSVPLTLLFEDARGQKSSLQLQVPVLAGAAAQPGSEHKH